MDVGHRIIEYVLAERDLSPFLGIGLTRDWLRSTRDLSRARVFARDEDLDAYATILDYHARYGQVPPLEEFRKSHPPEQLRLGRPGRSARELADAAARARAEWVVTDYVAELSELVTENETEEALRLLREASEELAVPLPDLHREMEIREEARRISVRDEARRRAASAGREPVEILPAGGLLARPDPPELIRGVMPATGIGSLVGPTQQYKSFVALDLALRVAGGRPWFGHAPGTPGPKSVLLALGEGQWDAARRLSAASDRHGLDPSGVSYMLRPGELADRSWVREFTDAARPVAPALVIFDSGQDFYGAIDDNVAADVQAVIRGMKEISSALDAMVLVVAHTGHDNRDRQRGSSRWRQAWDAEIGVNEEIIRCAKYKYGPPFDPIGFSVEQHAGSLVIAPDGQASADAALGRAPRADALADAIVTRVDAQPSGIRQALLVEEITRATGRSARTVEREIGRLIAARRLRERHGAGRGGPRVLIPGGDGE